MTDKKKPNLLRDGLNNNVVPQNTFTTPKLDTNKARKKEEKTTSIRIKMSTSDSLTALRTILAYRSVNEMIDDVIYEKVSKLDTSQREIYKASLKISELRREKK
jgi:hypothetical protein